MQGCGVALAGLVAVLLAAGCSAAIGGGRGGSGVSEGGMTRPLRPAVFHTPEELRHYLDAVSNYYAVASRPGRFGKRSRPLQREERVAALQRREGREGRDGRDAPPPLDRLAADPELDAVLDPAELVLPDFLYRLAAGPASDAFPASLYLDQERLSGRGASGANQVQE